MSNPFTTPFTCEVCGVTGFEIDMFPGSRCIGCHAAVFNAQPPVDVLGALAKGVRA